MKKAISLILSIIAAFSLTASALAADERSMSIPVTLTVVHTTQSIDVTLPASLPVSVVDGRVYTADDLSIRNNSTATRVRISSVSVTDSAYRVASYSNFPASASNRIALRINGCETTGAGNLSITSSAFPSIGAGDSLPIRYAAKVSDSGEVSGIRAANVVFTLRAG